MDTFHLPEGVWGIGINDSKIQPKLLKQHFQHAGVKESRQFVLGEKSEEIIGFVGFVVDLVNSHPGDWFFLIVDKNLEMDDDVASNHETVSGSECTKRVRNTLDPEQELRMLALVRSANKVLMHCTAPPNLHSLASASGFHTCLLWHGRMVDV